MAERTRKGGRRKKRCRRFCTGVSVVSLRLGKSHKKNIRPSNQIGAIYVPTKWGGTLFVHATRKYGKRKGTLKTVRLFYKDGKFENPPTVKEIEQGSNALGKWRKRYMYKVPTGKMGWFFVVVSGVSKAAVWNAFVQRHSLSRRPWNTWYWPHADNKNPNLYDQVVRYRKPHGGREPGPLAKYDQYTGQTSSSSSAREYEKINYRVSSGVSGHCDATAWAGFEETRPTGSKTVTSATGVRVTFREQCRIGMCTLRYWTSWGGEKNNDGTLHNLFVRRGKTYLKANWFHNKLRERIADNVGGIQIHDKRNWNYGIFKYRATFVAYGAKDPEINKVTIRTRLTYVGWGTVSSSAYRKWHGGPDRYIDTIYRLAYKNDGTIEKQLSAWKRQSIKGKSSREITAIFYANRNAPLINKKVSKTVLETIFR